MAPHCPSSQPSYSYWAGPRNLYASITFAYPSVTRTRPLTAQHVTLPHISRNQADRNWRVAAVEYGEHTEAAQRAMRQQAEVQAAAEARRRAKAMVVPTDDREVRVWLRRLKEPITLFGERAMERRERLRVLMTTLDESQRAELTARVMQLELEQKTVQAERFFTEGGPGLLEFRKCVLPLSNL